MSILDRPEIQAQIMAQSQITGYSPEYIANNMMVESGGNPTARSSAGAQGLMQFMPDTWNNLARQRPDLELNDPFDPEQSLKAYGALIQQIRGNNEMNTERESQVYHGGYDPAGYGPANRDYVERVGRFNQPRLSSGGQAGGGEVVQYQAERPQVQTAQTQRPRGSSADQLMRALEAQAQAEPNGWRDVAQAFGKASQHAPYMGNRGFGGGLVAGLNAGTALRAKDEIRQSKAQLELLKHKADMEYREDRDAVDDEQWMKNYSLNNEKFTEDKRQYGSDYAFRAREAGIKRQRADEKEARDLEREGGPRPAKLPGGYANWKDVSTVAEPMRDNYVRDIQLYKDLRKGVVNVQSLLKDKPDLKDWRAADASIAISTLQNLVDPRSQVSDSDMKRLSEGGSAESRLWSIIAKYKDGKAEIPEVELRNILNNINRLYSGHREDAQKIEAGFTQRASDMGLEQRHVFTPLDWPDPEMLIDGSPENNGGDVDETTLGDREAIMGKPKGRKPSFWDRIFDPDSYSESYGTGNY